MLTFYNEGEKAQNNTQVAELSPSLFENQRPQVLWVSCAYWSHT